MGNNPPEIGEVNEFNLFRTMEIVWKEIWIIALAAVLVTGLGFAYETISAPKNTARFDYSLSFHALDSFPGSETQPVRKNSIVENIFKETLEGNWKTRNRTLTSSGSPYKDINEFEAELSTAIEKINQFVLEEAAARLKLMDQSITHEMQTVEPIAQKHLNISFIVDAVANRNQDAVIVNNVSVQTSDLSTVSIILLGLLFGTSLGAAVIMFKHSYKKHLLDKNSSELSGVAT